MKHHGKGGHRGGQRKRGNYKPLKPYGFCCSAAADDGTFRYNKPTCISNSVSMGSLHESPCLKLREEVVLRWWPGKDSDSFHGTSAALTKDNNPVLTESAVKLAAVLARKARQEKYERDMSAWAAAGERRVKAMLEKKKNTIKICKDPRWYVEFSLDQLRMLHELEDALFKDKEEKSINRTYASLVNIGIFTDFAKVESNTIWKLLKEFSKEPIKFLAGIYSALTGQNIEINKQVYPSHEKILLSGLAFLELPKVIPELNKRMDPIIKYQYPEQPEPPPVIMPKKKKSPLLENLRMPFDWRLHRMHMDKWRKKYLAVPRPKVILPKIKVKQRENTPAMQELPHDPREQYSSLGLKPISHSISRSSLRRNTKSRLMSSKKLMSSKELMSMKSTRSTVEVVEEAPAAPTFPFSELPKWTEPPTPCPYKFQKLMKQVGPVETDKEFFAALKPPCKKDFPPGRKHLSVKMQSFLTETEQEMHLMMEQANRLTEEVGRIAEEVFTPIPRCDPCCSCKQTQKFHAREHATKTPHRVIDNVALDDENLILGTMAMHSPADSVSTLAEPIVIPSQDKIVQDKILGPITIVDGKPIATIEGVRKTLEHVPREELMPDRQEQPLRVVPPCNCAEDKEDEVTKGLELTCKDTCFGKKFHPKELAAFTCDQFAKQVQALDETYCGCGDDLDECDSNTDCGCCDDWEICQEDVCLSETDSGEIDCPYPSNVDTPKPDKRPQCYRCGRRVDKKLGPNDKQEFVYDCHCDSITDFLQMDITKTVCVRPGKEDYLKVKTAVKEKALCETKEEKRQAAETAGLAGAACAFKRTQERLKSANDEDEGQEDEDAKPPVKKMATEKLTLCEKIMIRKAKKEERDKKRKEANIPELDRCGNDVNAIQPAPEPEPAINPANPGGPYCDRTDSEKALAAQRTIAYLVDPPPGEQHLEMVPVREGGRPCRCRENRNKRKTLLYNIGGIKDQPGGAEAPALIEGVLFVTPDPSLRRSEEYIPVYELTESPYDKGVCVGPRKPPLPYPLREGCEVCAKEDADRTDEVRKAELEAADKDEYLVELYSRDRGKVPCFAKCCKLRDKFETDRKIKPMQPVCECKFERKLVQREEERKRWAERQSRLKTLPKQGFLHLQGLAQPTQFVDQGLQNDCEEEEMDALYEIDSVQLLVSAVTLQTPFDTPPSSKNFVNMEQEYCPPIATKRTLRIESKTQSDKKTEEQQLQGVRTVSQRTSQTTFGVDLSSMSDFVTLMKPKHKPKVKPVNVGIRLSDRLNVRLMFFEHTEASLTDRMIYELKNMSTKEFISLKLPKYHKMPQLQYWISYRVRGMCHTEDFKKMTILNSRKIWHEMKRKKKRGLIRPVPFDISDENAQKINFDQAMHWKNKIKVRKAMFWQNMSQSLADYAQEMWPTMEFGKFPNLLFKQCYFTYMPPIAKDIYLHAPFPRD